MTVTRYAIIAVVLASAFSVATILVFRAPALAHDWYPKECCHDVDCAPVDRVIQYSPVGGGLPQLVVTSKYGTVIVPPDFPRRASPDGRMHICIAGVYVRCLFMPPPL